MGDSEADCRQVVERLFQYIDGEIAGNDCQALEAHLRACAPCVDHVDFERNMKELVRRKCAEGGAPPDLAAKLKEHLNRVLDRPQA
ncbi:MAG: mycothiol system anti-sigma-R factor [Actinomycetota bacterium]